MLHRVQDVPHLDCIHLVYHSTRTCCKSSSLSTILFVCLMLSEVRSVRPVWLSGRAFQHLLSVGTRQRRGNAMPPSIQIAPPKLCQLGLSTGRDFSSVLEHASCPGAFPFLFLSLVCLLSFPRGRASSGDSREAPPCWATPPCTTIMSCVPRVPAYPRPPAPPSTCDLMDHLPDPINNT